MINVPTKAIASSTDNPDKIKACNDSVYQSSSSHTAIRFYWAISHSKMPLKEFEQLWIAQLNLNFN